MLSSRGGFGSIREIRFKYTLVGVLTKLSPFFFLPLPSPTQGKTKSLQVIVDVEEDGVL